MSELNSLFSILQTGSDMLIYGIAYVLWKMERENFKQDIRLKHIERKLKIETGL